MVEVPLRAALPGHEPLDERVSFTGHEHLQQPAAGPLLDRCEFGTGEVGAQVGLDDHRAAWATTILAASNIIRIAAAPSSALNGRSASSLRQRSLSSIS